MLGTVVRNGGVSPRRLHLLLGLMLRYAAFEPFRIAERLLFDRAIAAHTPHHDLIFILGHWRSGTTYLQTLLSYDPRFATSTLYSSLFADHFILTEPWLKPILNAVAKDLGVPHSLQRMPLDLDILAEGDVALYSQLSPYSYTWGHILPKRFETWFDRCIQHPDDEVAQGWLRHYGTFIRKLSKASGGRRVVMKSPGDTARVALLLRRYPNARLVYIHRNPLAVFHSNLYLWRVIRGEFSLQTISDGEAERLIIKTYRGLLTRYLEQRDAVPSSQLIEIHYEALRADPISELARVYEALGLGELPQPLQDSLATQDSYATNEYTTSPDLEARLRTEWAFSFDEWGV